MSSVKDKLLFCFLSALYVFLLAVTLGFFSFLVSPQLANLHILIPLGLKYLFYLFFGFIFFKLFFTFLSSFIGKQIFFFPKLEHKWLYMLAKLATSLGTLFGFAKDKVLWSFFAFNNDLVGFWPTRDGSKPLILLPRCLQNSECEEKVIEDIENCKRCNKCLLSEIVELKKVYDFDVHVVTGGELAKAVLLKLKPSFIIAVACENELLINTIEVPPYPIIGIPNERPNGPCKDTSADIAQIKYFMDLIAKKVG